MICPCKDSLKCAQKGSTKQKQALFRHKKLKLSTQTILYMPLKTLTVIYIHIYIFFYN